MSALFSIKKTNKKNILPLNLNVFNKKVNLGQSENCWMNVNCNQRQVQGSL